MREGTALEDAERSEIMRKKRKGEKDRKRGAVGEETVKGREERVREKAIMREGRALEDAQRSEIMRKKRK